MSRYSPNHCLTRKPKDAVDSVIIRLMNHETLTKTADAGGEKGGGFCRSFVLIDTAAALFCSTRIRRSVTVCDRARNERPSQSKVFVRQR